MLIQNIKKIKTQNWTRLNANVSWRDNRNHEIFFAIPSELSDFVDESSADPFIMSLIQIAAKHNESIEVVGAGVSHELINNIEEKLIPLLARIGCGNGGTKISAVDYHEIIDFEKIAATGISLGIDSFYSILTNTSKENNIPLNAVIYIHQVNDWKSFDELELNNSLKMQKSISDIYKLQLIPIVTNIRYVMENELVFGQFHTFCHVGSVAVLRGLINTYYYASAYSYDEMKMSFSDSGNYENVIQEVFTFDGFKMICSGAEVSRFEKTKFLSNIPIVSKFLDVCYHDKENDTGYLNCSSCAKCIRTMTTLDVLGKLEDFNEVFDIDLYKKTKSKCWADVKYRKVIGKDHFSIEICDAAKKAKYRIPLWHWLFFLKIGIRNQIVKFFKI